MDSVNFNDMERWSVKQLRAKRAKLRTLLADEIHRRDALKAEILFLQVEITKYQEE